MKNEETSLVHCSFRLQLYKLKSKECNFIFEVDMIVAELRKETIHA